MATRNQSDSIRQELNGTWQPISGSFNFSYTSIAGFPRLLLHHDGSLYVLAGTGAILWLKPEYQINGGAWTDSGWGPDGGKFTFPAGWDGTISLHCNRPCFPTAYPAGTVINTRVMAKCSGSVVLCDSLLDPYPDVSKTWVQSDSHQWNDAEDDVVIPLWGPIPDTGQTVQYSVGDDADYGWDVTEGSDTDGRAGFSYTKMDAAGGDLPPESLIWSYTRDNRTGLIYKMSASRMVWQDGINISASMTDLGRSWRVASPKEMLFLFDYHQTVYSLSPFFTSVYNVDKWWSTNQENPLNTAKYIHFYAYPFGAQVYSTYDKTSTPGTYVAFVSGPELLNDFVDNGDNTVTDRNTGFMWTNQTVGSMDWNQAIAFDASAFGGHNDWRLPNIKELFTIVDFSKLYSSTTAVDSGFFTINGGKEVWSSTTSPVSSANAATVDFNYGFAQIITAKSALKEALFIRNV